MATDGPEDAVDLSAPAELRALWPAFFEQTPLGKSRAAEALPPEDVPLRIFAEDIIPGTPARTWPGTRDDLSAHFRGLLPEFAGGPRVLHLLACSIVVIRKTRGRGPGLVLFQRILESGPKQVFGGLNSRWLTSVADTLADHGETPAQSALGLCGSLLANSVKLAETERHVFAVPRPWPPNARFAHGGHLYDGVLAFWTEKGDMIENLLKRVSRSHKQDRIGGLLVQEIMARMTTHDTVYRRLMELADTPHPPDVPDEVRQRLRRIANRRL